ncbi:MAG: SGNH/GDSL hydrolase family protein [Eggerthellaceae bacterium]|nr:SGNH/GDSL hydrolase family protein [Eggerthellaceae bacterium]
MLVALASVLAAILAAFLVVAASPDQADAATPSKTKYVMVGDSYSIKSKKHKVTNPWPERVRSSLGLSKKQCAIYRHSGYGFSLKGRKFISLFSGVERDPSVTAVLIVGGAGNDRAVPLKTERLWYSKTIKRLRYLYPNAVIMHTITSWHLGDASYRKAMVKRIPYYKKFAKENKVVFLSGCEKVLRNHPSYFSSDLRHPNEKGHKAMARVIVKAIKKLDQPAVTNTKLKSSQAA